MNKAVIVVFLVVAAVVGGILFKEFEGKGGNEFSRGNRTIVVEVATANIQEIELHTEAVGTTYAKESVEITTNVSETIESIHFDDGDNVKKGDVLVVLTNNEEQADLLSAQANFNEQQREVKRLQDLVKTNSVSQNLVDERATLAETAEHRVGAAEARLRDRIIRAPFDGVLGLRQISPGTLVGPGTVITTLDDVAFMKLDFAVPEIYLTSVVPGIQIESSSPALGGKSFSGKIVGVDSRINPVDRSIKIRAEIPNTEGNIKPGMLMNVDILIENRPALTVPEAAVFMRGSQHYVYTVIQAETPIAKIREVSTGLRQPGLVEIVGGLEEGEQIVVKGTSTVSEGSPITITSSDQG